MEKSLQNIRRLLGEKATLFWRTRFERIQQMPGAGRKFKRIATTPNEEQLKDYLAEIRYALIFAGLGFQVDAEPLEEKGPDFRITRDNHSAFLEVTRFRTIHPGPPPISLYDKDFIDNTFLFEEYGNPARDVKKASAKIEHKLRQIGDKESIIAIWNDEGDLEDLEVENAVALLFKAAKQIISPPSGLSFVLYGSNRMIKRNKQFYCFPARTPLEPHQEIWKEELEQARVDELIQRALQRGKSTS
jgi:hypothetical protein